MRIAIADDDDDIREFIRTTLGGAGYSCVAVSNGRDVITELKRETYDLLMLDWNMPSMSGIEVVSWTHQNLDNVPYIIMLTSRGDKDDVVRALEAGADDYIVKPEQADVILARVASAFRRAGTGKAADRFNQCGRYSFDKLSLVAKFNGNEVALTAKEFALILLFFDNLQRPLSRNYIMQRVWNNVADLSTRTLDMHVSRLRTKLALRPENGYSLQTIFGYGYRLDSFGESNDSDT